VDGKPWPLADDSTVWLPAGVHTIEPASAQGDRILDFNGEAQTAEILAGGELLLGYSSASRAIAILEKRPTRIEVDGVAAADVLASGANWALMLPRGKHTVKISSTPQK
jgi:hypothetical protein